MISKTKTVFYCEFCKKHRLSRVAMEKHELHCTMNSERTCRWHLLEDLNRYSYKPSERNHQMRRGLPRWVKMFAPLGEPVLVKMREHARDCPACMLTAVRLSGIDSFGRDRFNYETEIERYREEEHNYQERQERWEIESTFL